MQDTQAIPSRRCGSFFVSSEDELQTTAAVAAHAARGRWHASDDKSMLLFVLMVTLAHGTQAIAWTPVAPCPDLDTIQCPHLDATGVCTGACLRACAGECGPSAEAMQQRCPLSCGWIASAAPTSVPTGAPAAAPTSATRTIYLTMPGSVEEYDEQKLGLLAEQIAASINIEPSEIVMSVSAGSVLLSVTLPAEAAEAIIEQYKTGEMTQLAGADVVVSASKESVGLKGDAMPAQARSSGHPIDAQLGPKSRRAALLTFIPSEHHARQSTALGSKAPVSYPNTVDEYEARWDTPTEVNAATGAASGSFGAAMFACVIGAAMVARYDLH